MLKFKKLIPIFMGVMLTHSTSSLASHPPLGFESGEHVAAGDSVKLLFASDQPAKQYYALHLPNGLQLTYGELVAMGDFYGIAEKPISHGNTGPELKANFIAAFNTLAASTAAFAEAPKIIDVIKSEQNAVADGMKQGIKPEVTYAKISNDGDRLWNCITGGGCTSTWYLQPGRYFLLAKENFDHFGYDAWLAYLAGHLVALDTAIAAHATHDTKQLELAYAMNAFACHFLSDLFATGHMRTPRLELPISVTPRDLGSLLASAMHNEENKFGLHVHNLRGDHWIAYGDKYYFDSINQANRDLLNETLQKSADEIFSAYQSGVVPAENSAVNLIPQPDEINNLGTQDVAPLFYWDTEKHILYRRSDVNNPYDRQWTADWWGWTTLILLQKNNSLSTVEQAELVKSGLGDEAVKYGLITDKQVLQMMKSN